MIWAKIFKKILSIFQQIVIFDYLESLWICVSVLERIGREQEELKLTRSIPTFIRPVSLFSIEF